MTSILRWQVEAADDDDGGFDDDEEERRVIDGGAKGKTATKKRTRRSGKGKEVDPDTVFGYGGPLSRRSMP